jgi:phosphatidylglycerol:prolipoprotein diacylglycerol transferase
MHQELFRIPFLDRPVYGYGLMLVIGFLLGAQLAKFLARRCGLNGDHFVTGCLIGLIAGVVGARLSHVLESLANPLSHEFSRNGRSAWENFASMLNVSSGGLTFYGGFLLATPVLIGYAIWRKIPLFKGMDIIAPSLMLGLAFGRIGCYMNGCCYGEECSLPWGASFPYGSNAFVDQNAKGEIAPGDIPPELTDPDPAHAIRREAPDPGHAPAVDAGAQWLPRLLTKDEVRAKHLESLAASVRAKPVHPTELYSAFNAFFIAGILFVYFTLSPAPGRVFAMMLILKGITRFVMEMIRVEPPVIPSLNWSFSMVVSACLAVAGVIMWLACARRGERRVAPAALAA